MSSQITLRTCDIESTLLGEAQKLRDHVSDCESKSPYICSLSSYVLESGQQLKIALKIDESKRVATAYISNEVDKNIKEIIENTFKDVFKICYSPKPFSELPRNYCSEGCSDWDRAIARKNTIV